MTTYLSVVAMTLVVSALLFPAIATTLNTHDDRRNHRWSRFWIVTLSAALVICIALVIYGFVHDW